MFGMEWVYTEHEVVEWMPGAVGESLAKFERRLCE